MVLVEGAWGAREVLVRDSCGHLTGSSSYGYFASAKAIMARRNPIKGPELWRGRDFEGARDFEGYTRIAHRGTT